MTMTHSFVFARVKVAGDAVRAQRIAEAKRQRSIREMNRARVHRREKELDR
jgi:hypothetical protein